MLPSQVKRQRHPGNPGLRCVFCSFSSVSHCFFGLRTTLDENRGVHGSMGMTDKQGSVNYLALRWKSGWGMLADHPKERLEELHSKISADFDPANASEADKLAKISGCLDRLNAFLLQVYRISKHAERLRRSDTMIAMLPPEAEIQGDPNALQALESMPRIPGTTGVRMEDCCADFESLIFHGSAALDRLSKYLINAAHFRKLKTRLDSGKSKYDHRGQRRQLLRESP